ncbi:hypothetical protein OF83DRAFT_412344 [Amylostereum chailletii]|nr:hypothetical protein OF83DRAFT_412344 [Amylostereum chailletii]
MNRTHSSGSLTRRRRAVTVSAHIAGISAIFERGPEVISSQGMAEEFDQDLAVMKQLVTTLENRRAACRASVALSKFPVEILGEIMAILVDVWPLISACNRGTPSLGWMQITHVCRHWRDVALDMPMLWTKNICTLTDAADTMLERARDLPVDMVCNCDNHTETEWPIIFQFCLSNFHRARSLYLCFEDEDYEKVAAALSSQPLPHLESFKIGWGVDLRHPGIFDFPYLIAPKLRTVSLNDGFLPWDPSAIHHIDAIVSDNDLNSEPSPTRLLTLLRDSCNLRHLKLVGWISTDFIAFHDQAFIASLPHLEYMYLESSPRRAMAVMSHLSFPKTTRIALELHEYPENDDSSSVACSDFLEIITFLRPRVSRAASVGLLLTTVNSDLWSDDGFRMVLLTSSSDNMDNAFKDRNKEQLDLRASTTSFTTQELLTICRRAQRDLLLEDIDTLELDRLADYTTENWEELFGLFPRVESLRIRTTSGLSNLSNLVISLMPSRVSRAFLPALDHIHIDINVSTLEATDDYRLVLAHFLGIVHARAALGFGIHRITFRGYRAKDSYRSGCVEKVDILEHLEAAGVLRGLEDIVPHLEVD